MTLAQRFISKARELLPEQNDLQNLDTAIDSATVIDEIMFSRGEYIGGMAAAILAMLASEKQANAGDLPLLKTIDIGHGSVGTRVAPA